MCGDYLTYRDDLKYEDNLKYKDDLKYEDNLKYKDDRKYGDKLKYEDDYKYEDKLNYEDKLKLFCEAYRRYFALQCDHLQPCQKFWLIPFARINYRG